MIVAFCGHSDYAGNPTDEKKILNILEKEIQDKPVEFFLGGYGGFDKFSHCCAKKYKSRHKNARIVLITPYLPTRNVSDQERENFDLLLYPPLESIPPRYAIVQRNKWIVSQADLIIAYVKNSFGGAYAMYRYAQKQNKTIYNIVP